MPTELFRSVQDYLQYLIESNVQDICITRSEPETGFFEEKEEAFSLPDECPQLDTVKMELKDCQRCSLAKDRNHIVFGQGNPAADIVIVGDIPSYEADQSGNFFDGKAGELLIKIIEKGMNTPCSDIYVCSILKCRPLLAGNLNTEPIQACLPFFIKQLESIKPKVIILLGLAAAQILLHVSDSIEQLRGKWHVYRDIPVMPTFHPEYVNTNYTVPIRKKVWEDVQKAKQFAEKGRR